MQAWGRSALPLALVAGLLGAAPVAVAAEPPAGELPGYVIPPTERGRVVDLWKAGSPGVKAAAEVALTGTDAQVKTFLEQAGGIAFQDDRLSVAQVAGMGGSGTQEAASKALAANTPAAMKAFLDEGWKAPYEQDQRVKVAQVIANATPNVQEKGRAALQNGTPTAIRAFLEEGQYTERDQDERIQLAQILSIGGPNIRDAGRLALRGSADDIRDFLDVGQHVARARDQEHATIAQLLEQVKEAGRQAGIETAAAKEASARAVKSAQLAKVAAQEAAKETEAARTDSVRAAAAAGRAAEASREAASAAQKAIGSARAAASAARLASNAAAQAADAAAGAGRAATRARNAAADAATDATKAGAARLAAEEARTAVKFVREVAKVAEQAEASANAAGDAADAAIGAGENALISADAAIAASDFADKAGVSSAQARTAAAEARRHANEAKRAAGEAARLARKAAIAARESRDAANSAADHAEKAAIAADEAAKHAGDAATAAAQSTAHAKAATEAAAAATAAVGKIKNVYVIAREIEAEELLGRTNAGLGKARDLKTAEDEEKAAAAQRVQQSTALEAEAKQLATDAAKPGADVKAIAVRARKAALQTAKIRGDWSKVAAEIALAGNDTEITAYVRTGWTKADQQDQRTQAEYLAWESPLAPVRAAAEQALKGDAAAVTAFLTTGQYQAGKEEFRVHIAQLIADAGPNTTEAGNTALASGSLDKYVAFIRTGYDAARIQDERIRAAQLADSGGPELKSRARIALDGPNDKLHTFIQAGQHAAQRADLLSLTHQQRIQQLIAEAARIAATAQQDAAKANEVAATARKAAEEAKGYAQQAEASAADANRYKEQAAKSAKDAEASAAQAAASAKTARAAANQAVQSAQNASTSAADASISARSARSSAETAWASAAKARENFLAANNDAVAAIKVAEAAFADARDRQEEMWAEARRKANEPGAQARKQYRCGFAGLGCMSEEQGALKCWKMGPGCMIAVEIADNLGPLIEKIVNQGLGLSNFYNCFEYRDMGACTDLARDQAINSKIRLLRLAGVGLKSLLTKGGCTKCFLAGTKVLMANGSTRSIENVGAGDLVATTNPVTGETSARRVTQQIITQGDKQFNELELRTGRGLEKLTATHEHPFWSPSEHRWIEARGLRQGMTLLARDGSTIPLQGNRSFERNARTYNLTVEGVHTYYVLAGATPVLVHNSGCGGIALGLQDVDGDDMALDIFGMERGALTHKEWEGSGSWYSQVDGFLSDGKTGIHVNLDGIDNPKEYAKSGESVNPAVDDAGFTAWELYRLRESPGAWSRVTWYRNGREVPNPFE